MVRFGIAAGLIALALIGCSHQQSEGGSTRNFVDQCVAERGVLADNQLKQCVSDKIKAECGVAGTPGSAAYDQCHRDLARQALTRDQVQRMGF